MGRYVHVYYLIVYNLKLGNNWWKPSLWLPKFLIILSLTGVGEEEKGEGTIGLWEEEAAQQTEGEGWEDRGGKAWPSTWNPCSR